MPRLTKRVIDSTKPGEERFILWDDALKGFGLLVLPSGVKSFIYDYRTTEGRKRRATICKAGALTPDEARQKAEEMARQVKLESRDPLAERIAAREALTVGEMLDAYLSSDAFAAKAESTQAIDRGRVERHIRPLLGKKFAHLVTAEDVQKAFRQIVEGKTAGTVKTDKKHGLARVRGGEGTARAAVRLLRAVYNWAADKPLSLKVENPASNVKIGRDGERDTILDGADDYARLFTTLAAMEDEHRIRGPVADAIRVLAMTGARRGEITGLRWRHVDLRAGRVVLPPSSHKTGKKTGQARVIPLPAAAQEIISRQPMGELDDLVFRPAKGEGGVLNINKPWRLVRAEAGLPEGIGLHGLRHSVASLMAMDGAQASQIQAITGHRDIRMVQRYVHFAEQAKSALAERAAAPAMAGLAAAEGRPPAEVIPIKKEK
jgi:integrase